MRTERIIDENGKPIMFRVVMSGEFHMPQEGFIRKQIARNRLNYIIPDYDMLSKFTKRRYRLEIGIVICKLCQYPQPIENTICCFCEEELNPY